VSALGVVALVLGILAFIALTFALVMIPVARRAKRVAAEMDAQVGEGERAENVRGLGLESRGRGQVRDLDAWLAALAPAGAAVPPADAAEPEARR
jgi:hypothetical protein